MTGFSTLSIQQHFLLLLHINTGTLKVESAVDVDFCRARRQENGRGEDCLPHLSLPFLFWLLMKI